MHISGSQPIKKLLKKRDARPDPQFLRGSDPRFLQGSDPQRKLRPAMASLGGPFQGHTQPIEVPKPWLNVLNQNAVDWIYQETGCSVSLREWAAWGNGKRLVAAGPLGGLEEAVELATKHLLGTLAQQMEVQPDTRERHAAFREQRREDWPQGEDPPPPSPAPPTPRGHYRRARVEKH